jgi:membrane fusion protein, multidrug efflux system
MTPEIVEPRIEPGISPRPDPHKPPPTKHEQHPAPPPKRKRSVWPWILLLIAAGAGAYFYPRLSEETQAPAAGKKGGGKGNDPNRPVPVVAATARRGDMPVYLDGLGSVLAFNTVTLKTRVDGQIMKVAFTEGQFVKEGDTLIEIDPRPFQVQLEQAEAQLAHDQALLSNARLDLERYRVLLAQDAVPKQQYDTQIATVQQYDATIKTDQAAIDNAKLQLVYAHITSPLTGRIGLRLVDQGNIVHATDTTGLAVITQLQPIAVIFNIAEDHLPAVAKKMNAGQKLTVVAYDRDSKAKLAEGFLLTIDNQIDQTTGTVKFKGQFENQDLSLFPNQFVNARLLLEMKHGAVIIPTAAVQKMPDGTSSFVYVVKDNNTVDVRKIVTSTVEGDEVQADSGIEAGEKVVIDGIDKLQQNSRVTVQMAGGRGAKTGG